MNTALFIIIQFSLISSELRITTIFSFFAFKVATHLNVGKGSKIIPGKKAIYLQHGLVDSADTWIVNDESLAPAFYLANQGYDIWLGNSRGNRYSNILLNPRNKNFWDFTFD
jgi:hypothetical protein